ncbi:hypothetical protein [Sphingobium subterraneum]|uniref:Uncharacterized protein n=1 Tax=Sphingobium subterraneum TaxID=627688 RepID=A0A841IV91_9SPHN|nr:hypothetical protein [Sphingobium subterraneum]MBB6122839.1 hypothetical protein [Sphingobium subterraneum]
MIQSIVSLMAIITLAEMSRRANWRYRHEVRLPMQWLLDGTVTRTASRRFALAFIPILLSGILTATVVMSMVLTPRSGQEGFVIPVIALMALLFVGIHAFYLRLIAKSLGGWGK